MFLFLLRVRFDGKFGFRFCGRGWWGWSFERRGSTAFLLLLALFFVHLFPSRDRGRWWRCQGRFFNFGRSSSNFGR